MPKPAVSVNIPARALTSVEALVEHGVVAEDAGDALRPVEENFSIRLTPETFRQMRTPDAYDPVYAQYVPSTDELDVALEELSDPIGDELLGNESIHNESMNLFLVACSPRQG